MQFGQHSFCERITLQTTMFPVTSQPQRSYGAGREEYSLDERNGRPTTGFHFLPASDELARATSLVVQQKIPHDVRGLRAVTQTIHSVPWL